MNQKIKLAKKDAKPLLQATFPDYTGRKFFVELADKVTFSDTNWGGGSRNFYAAVNRDGKAAHLFVPAPWLNVIEGQTINLPADVIIAVHCIFCGHDLGITFYLHPVNAPQWLPSGN